MNNLFNNVNDESIGVTKNVYVSLPFRNIRTAVSYKEIDISESEKLLEGFIYVLSNESMPNIYKIGMTSVSPLERAKALSSSSGVPTPFKVEHYFHVKDMSTAEAAVHSYLSEYRVNNKREFFKCSIEDVKEALSNTADYIDGLEEEAVFFQRHVISLGSSKSQKRNIHISADVFERLQEESCDSADQLAENIISLFLNNLSCSIAFIDGKAIAFPSPEWEGAPSIDSISEFERPSIINTRKLKVGF